MKSYTPKNSQFIVVCTSSYSLIFVVYMSVYYTMMIHVNGISIDCVFLRNCQLWQNSRFFVIKIFFTVTLVQYITFVIRLQLQYLKLCKLMSYIMSFLFQSKIQGNFLCAYLFHRSIDNKSQNIICGTIKLLLFRINVYSQ